MLDWIAFLFVLESGLIPSNGWDVQATAPSDTSMDGVYTHFDGEIELFDHFFAGGYATSRFGPETGDSGAFSPSGVRWQWRVGARFDMLEIGFRHFSTHPVTPYVEMKPYTQPMPSEGGYEELYVRLEGRVGQ
jgi:hypothetical protein